MAKRHSIVSKVRPGRNTVPVDPSKKSGGRKSPDVDDGDSKPEPRTLEQAIEDERSRLMRAQIVLSCVAFSLNHSDWREESGTDYAGAVEAACQLIHESIDQLDLVNLPSPARGSKQIDPPDTE